MIVVIRADASGRIGSGHVMRCLTLAEGLRKHGATVSFACRDHQGHLAALIGGRGFAVDLLSGHEPEREEGPHGDWLGVGWRTDAEQTAQAIRNRHGRADWLVVDHYAIDARWERAVRPAARRILVIDDLADRPHDCDILLDQNVPTAVQSGYGALLPAATRRLIGMRYLLLRAEFASAPGIAPRSGTPRALVFFGGSDPSGMTLRLLERAAKSGLDLKLCVLVGVGNRDRDRIEALCRAGGHEFHVNATNVAELIAGCDLAIAACGFFAYELMALGVPALLTAQSDIQWTVAKALEGLGVATALAAGDFLDPGKLRAAIALTLSIPRDGEGFGLVSRDGVGNVISEMKSFPR